MDGFNLYHALRKQGWQRFYWLNIHALASRFLLPGETLVQTRYYTSRVFGDAKYARQAAFINALLTVPEIEIRYGQMRNRPRDCGLCGGEEWVPVEKMTDVNIASDLLIDSFKARVDTILLLSADSDLTGPLRWIRNEYPHIQIRILFPPGKDSGDLTQYAHNAQQIGRARFNQSQFPAEVTQANGIVIRRPVEWAAAPASSK